MQELLSGLLEGLSPEVRAHVITTLAYVIVLGIARWGVLRVMRRLVESPEQRYRWRKGITYGTVVLALLLVGRVWSEEIGDVGTFLGLFTAALAIALREPVANLAGWLFILWRRPFRVGDRIQLGEHSGDVVDIRLFQFSLLEIGNWVNGDQTTGRIVHIPNGKVFTDAQANYDGAFPFIWHELPVLVTFESNWVAAKALLQEILDRHGMPARDASKRVQTASYAISRLAADPEVITTVAESGVLLTVRYLCEPRRRRATEQAIWEEVLRDFAARDDIDFAYPTRRFFDNIAEGKPAARAEGRPNRSPR